MNRRKQARDAEARSDVRSPWEEELRERIRADEATFGASGKATDSLWDHLVRVALIAERLGREEGLDPALCRMAGLFHDAGKFSGGRYHEEGSLEEEESVALLKEMAASHKMPPRTVDEAAAAITRLYCDDPGPTPLAGVLFDADNLEKLGALGAANFFVKAGLRGRGVSPKLLYQLTVELTYVHHAPECFFTPSGRALAKRRAEESKKFFLRFLDEVREDGLYDFRIEEVTFEGLRLQVVAPESCACGGRIERRVWSERGVKCEEVHLEHRCPDCEECNRLRFCRPRLVTPND